MLQIFDGYSEESGMLADISVSQNASGMSYSGSAVAGSFKILVALITDVSDVDGEFEAKYDSLGSCRI